MLTEEMKVNKVKTKKKKRRPRLYSINHSKFF